MERTKWTDERLDERMDAIDDKFDRLFSELHMLREEMRAGFAELRAELRGEIGGLRSDLAASQRQLTFIVATFAVGLLGVLGAFVATQL
jgi:hypothetical protein